VQKIILGTDPSAKDKKLKELVKRNKILTVKLEKEKRVYRFNCLNYLFIRR
jgi:hypothetical protein